jgi:hypothetical protein
VAENGVEPTLWVLRCVVRVETFHLESLLAQEINIGAVTAAEVEHATFDVTQSEELSGRKRRSVSVLGREM